MTKAIVFFGPQGIALVPAILCADNPVEAEQHSIPLFDEVFAKISAGMEVRRNADSAYELYEKGRFVGMIEVRERPNLDGEDKVEVLLRHDASG